MKNIVLFGPPGAGKGTQAVMLAKQLELIHISTGDIFRKEMSTESDLGRKARSFIEQGKLVPDDVTIDMLETHMRALNNGKGFVFDGFPRTISQAVALDRLLDKFNTRVTQVISLEVPDEELVSRLQNRAQVSGRIDDMDINIIRNRLNVYKKETLPLKNYYEKKGILFEVPGVGKIEQIFSDICRLFSF